LHHSLFQGVTYRPSTLLFILVKDYHDNSKDSFGTLKLYRICC
jgi:hypothetical protein